jgi:hypothetical protein
MDLRGGLVVEGWMSCGKSETANHANFREWGGSLFFVLCSSCFVLCALCLVLCALCFVKSPHRGWDNLSQSLTALMGITKRGKYRKNTEGAKGRVGPPGRPICPVRAGCNCEKHWRRLMHLTPLATSRRTTAGHALPVPTASPPPNLPPIPPFA